MLELRHIEKYYNAGTVNEMCLFQDFNLTIKDHQFVSVVGSNGSGKTSMLNLICGSIPVDEGRILMNGKDITKLPEHKRLRSCLLYTSYIHTQDAAEGCDAEAPYACREGKTLMLCKAVFRIKFSDTSAQRNVGSKMCIRDRPCNLYRQQGKRRIKGFKLDGIPERKHL